MNYYGPAFRTTLFAAQDGVGTYGIVESQERDGTWRRRDETRVYKEYPSMIRARAAAENLARQWAKKLYPDAIATFTRN